MEKTFSRKINKHFSQTILYALSNLIFKKKIRYSALRWRSYRGMILRKKEVNVNDFARKKNSTKSYADSINLICNEFQLNCDLSQKNAPFEKFKFCAKYEIGMHRNQRIQTQMHYRKWITVECRHTTFNLNASPNSVLIYGRKNLGTMYFDMGWRGYKTNSIPNQWVTICFTDLLLGNLFFAQVIVHTIIMWCVNSRSTILFDH